MPPESSGIPPAAALNPSNPPAVRLEVESGAESSVDDAWERLRSTPKPSPADWEALIRAERISRMAWLQDEDSGAHKRQPSLAEFMQPKKPRASKSSSKKVDKTDSPHTRRRITHKSRLEPS